MYGKALFTAVSASVIGLAMVAGAAHAQYYDGVDAGFPAPTGDSAFIPSGSKLMRLFDGGCILTEGVAAGHDGYLYFSDITFTKFCPDPSGTFMQAGNIWRYDPTNGDTTMARPITEAETVGMPQSWSNKADRECRPDPTALGTFICRSRGRVTVRGS